MFQLAHESVHLLNPIVFGLATVLEEGLATHFSLQYIKQFHSNYICSDKKYMVLSRDPSEKTCKMVWERLLRIAFSDFRIKIKFAGKNSYTYSQIIALSWKQY